MNLLKKYWLTVTGAFVGLVAGYFYWLYIGCASGTCPITSNPLNSSVYGAIMGGLFFNIFQKDKNKNQQQNQNQ